MSTVISKTPILGLHIVQPDIFKDFRGDYAEIFNSGVVNVDCGLRFPMFVQDDVILSRKYVLRGYHGDNVTWKYVTCLHGAFFIVVVDIDPHSATFMRHESLMLDDRERKCLLIPPKYVNAHKCVTDTCLFFYKQTTYYRGEVHQYSIQWDSIPNVYWGGVPVLSERDANRAKSVNAYIKDGVLLTPEEGNV